MKTLILPSVALGALALLAGCSSEGSGDGGECRDGKCDDLDKPDSEVEDSPCDGVMLDASGRNNGKVAGRLNDPIALMAFRSGDDCPTSYQDIMAKLRSLDTEGCAEDDPRAGISTRLVSETAQATGQPTNYRAVVTRTCANRPRHGVVFSLFGVRAGATELPPNVEIMAFDETAGVFNYYETDGSEIKFFGNSKDMLQGSPDGQTRRCAGCHNGGGMVMKELHTPWLHWEGHMNTPGAAELVAAHEDLGSKSDGAELEGLVKTANRQWNETRVAHAIENLPVREILKPLFCTVEINLDNGADFFSPADGKKGTCSQDETITCNIDDDCGAGNSCQQGSLMTRVPADVLLDPVLKSFGSININHDDYQALLAANGSQLQGIPGTADTVFDFVFPERAEIDKDYVDQLVGAGVIDDELVKDVLMVDFTRPIFSSDRCDLLEFAPVLSKDDLNPENLRQGFIANLGSPAAGTPAAELLANLSTQGENHQERVDAFFNSCSSQDQSDLMTSVYSVVSGLRAQARELQVMEFPQTAPTDSLSVAGGTRLDPTTCQLTADFVSVADTSALPPPGPEPEPDSGECSFDPKVAQTDPQQAGTPGDCACVDAICGADAFCCNDHWDSTCASAASSEAACQ
jgi:hypothetical protein